MIALLVLRSTSGRGQSRIISAGGEITTVSVLTTGWVVQAVDSSMDGTDNRSRRDSLRPLLDVGLDVHLADNGSDLGLALIKLIVPYL